MDRTGQRVSLLPILAVAGMCLSPSALAGQDAPPPTPGTHLNVFFDCQGFRCDGTSRTHYRTEIDWVNWVNVREGADVHVIMTSEGNASGGRAFQIDFLGTEAFDGTDDQLIFRSIGTDTEQEERDGIASTLAIGLARFSSLAGLRGIVTIQAAPSSGADPTARVVSSQEVDDPWNLWVFRLGGSGNIQGESTRETVRVNWNASASRTTPQWKLSFGGRGSFERQEIQRSDSSILISEQTEYSWNNLVAYSLAEHWSVGFNSSFRKSPRDNQDFSVSFRPGIEWSYFPYEEATRRALTAFYEIGPTYWDYEDRTFFGELSETRFDQSLGLELSQRQQWGDASISIEGSHFLHDLELNRLELEGDVSFRIFRGLSLNAGASYSVVNDQIYLSADGASDEEILLRLQNRATDSEYCLNIGFSYQFGSIFNNVVNNRFPFQGGGFGGGGGGGGGGRGGGGC